MTGIYIHVPFCVQRCHYCDFYSSILLKDKDIFVDTLLREISARKNFVKNNNVDTIYFGGGTPSLLSAPAIRRIITEIAKNFRLSDDIEITLEVNPDDLDKQYLEDIRKAGVNRLSIGIQSFDNDQLVFMNRAHNANEALGCVKLAQDLGFDNITIDLIYGLPETENDYWLNQ